MPSHDSKPTDQAKPDSHDSDKSAEPKRSSSAAEIESILKTRISEAEEAREEQGLIFLNCYLDYMARPRADDTAGTGAARAIKTEEVFIRQSRSKVRTARAKIKDALFGSGQLPIDSYPDEEDNKQYADTVERILRKILEIGEFRKVLSEAIDGLCIYGTDFIAGPFVKDASWRKVVHKPDPDGHTRLVEDKFDYALPYFQHARQLDVYPDPDAENENDGLGLAWVTRHEKTSLKNRLKKQGGYKNLERAFGSSTRLIKNQSGSEAIEDEGSTPNRKAGRRAEVVHYFGLLPRALVKGFGSDEHPDYDEEDLIESITVLVNGVAVKCGENKFDHRLFYRCCYEQTSHDFWGVGIAENNFTQQKITNAAFRLYLEGKGYALLKTATVDRSKFLPHEDFERFPGKIYETIPGLTPEEIKSAIIYHDVVDVTQGWESVISISEKFSDDETNINKYTMGNDGGHLNETATGISMIMNASSLPLKEVIQSIDDNYIIRPINTVMKWCLQNLQPETVGYLTNEKDAQNWYAVQQYWRDYGHADFIGWKATGASTFVAKEILLSKLHGFLQIVSADPTSVQFVDKRELLQQVWDAGQINQESVVYDEETVKKRMAEAAQQPNPQIQAMQAQLQQKLQEVQMKVEADMRASMGNIEAKLEEARLQHEAKMRELDLKEREVEVKEKMLDVELLRIRKGER